jgi:hypothetical protein
MLQRVASTVVLTLPQRRQTEEINYVSRRVVELRVPWAAAERREYQRPPG